MKKESFNLNHKEFLDSFLLKIPDIKYKKMFGYPAYFAKGKMFVCVYGEGVGIKVPNILAKQLLKKKSVIPFQPLGKSKMNEWIQINRKSSKDYIKDKNIFLSSIKFVLS